MNGISYKILLKYVGETDKCRRNELFEIAEGLNVPTGKGTAGKVPLSRSNPCEHETVS